MLFISLLYFSMLMSLLYETLIKNLGCLLIIISEYGLQFSWYLKGYAKANSMNIYVSFFYVAIISKG